MPARRIGSGVVKSGSPIVRLMTSFISASMSKNRRIPEGGISRTRWFRKSAVARRVAGWLAIAASLAAWGPDLDARPLRFARMAEAELILLLLSVVAAVTLIATRIGIAYPILMVIAGLILGYVLGL